jgi:hypothetical protein
MNRSMSFLFAIGLVALVLAFSIDTASAQTTKAPGKGATQMSWGSFDDDGDGIPNCQDPDYVRPLDGTGKKLGRMQGGKHGQGYGTNGSGSVSGTGTGTGTGVCDGTGPKGKGRSK